MLNFFRKPKINIHTISIPDFGWTKEKETESIIQWINPDEAMALSVNFFPAKPDIPTMKDIEQVRQFYRNNIVQVNGGLIQVDFMDFSGVAGIKTIFKIPQESTGTTYLASCTIPFANYSYVVKIQAPELGIIGFRETAISDRLIKEKVIESKENGWLCDPYDVDFKGGTPMNKSENSQYDSQFPSHPLTLARKFIDQVATQIKFYTEVYKVKSFRK